MLIVAQAAKPDIITKTTQRIATSKNKLNFEVSTVSGAYKLLKIVLKVNAS